MLAAYEGAQPVDARVEGRGTGTIRLAGRAALPLNAPAAGATRDEQAIAIAATAHMFALVATAFAEQWALLVALTATAAKAADAGGLTCAIRIPSALGTAARETP